VSPRPGTQPHPPVFVGGMGKNAARRAARFGLPFQPGAHHPEAFALYQKLCEEKGVPPVLLAPPPDGELMVVSEDPDRSWAEIGKFLLHDAMSYASWQPAGQRSTVHSDATTVEELRAEGSYAIRTPEECIETAKAGGPFTSFIHYPLCGGLPPEHGWQSLKLFVEKVMPSLGSDLDEGDGSIS
jgi:alkanesulfonate monooxygenase SsuD/methylene tetrahydromethanopterin reductase-like flavin-dependent oxidoreductase (luciferase family)